MAEKPTARRLHWSFRRKLLIGTAVIVAFALALGLGLGLTLGHDDGDDNEGPQPTSTSPPLPSPSGSLPWKPKVNDTWQIVLLNNIELASDAKSVTPNVSIFDIDLFDTDTDTIDMLHRLGKKVICYFSGGSYEPGRPDSDEFEDGDMGKELDGWPGEKWLRLGSDNVRRIMKGRIELAAKKGCDGVDPDNVDGFQNDNGLNLTADDSVSFMSYLSTLTTPLKLTMGLKNAGDIVQQVLPIVDFSVNEQCVANVECDVFHAFIDAGKPVFHIEYPNGAGDDLEDTTVEHYCKDDGNAKGSEGFSTVLKKMNLDGWVEYCDRKVDVTAMNQTESSH